MILRLLPTLISKTELRSTPLEPLKVADPATVMVINSSRGNRPLPVKTLVNGEKGLNAERVKSPPN